MMAADQKQFDRVLFFFFFCLGRLLPVLLATAVAESIPAREMHSSTIAGQDELLSYHFVLLLPSPRRPSRRRSTAEE